MSEELDFLGNVDKDKRYRKRLMAELKRRFPKDENGQRDHPVFHNVLMQAHHLLSEKGIRNSELGDELEHRGYDMNVVENLSLLPSEPIGACHLEVQLHRGDHKKKSAFTGRSYHNEVKYQVKQIQATIMSCGRNTHQAMDVTCRAMNNRSSKMLKLIASFKMPLTYIDEAFDPDSKTGCGNQSSVPGHQANATECDCGRNHFNHNNASGKKITFLKQKFELKVGQ